MASFEKAFEILKQLEYSSPKDALHKNPGEKGYTFMGVYQCAHDNAILWHEVRETLKKHNDDIAKASVELYSNSLVLDRVNHIYVTDYWNKAKLGEVKSQQIANEIFIFGVNVGMRNAIRKAQKLVGAVDDGIAGSMTIQALNEADEKKFDFEFDELELQYYSSIIQKKPSLARFKKGWTNRAKFV